MTGVGSVWQPAAPRDEGPSDGATEASLDAIVEAVRGILAGGAIPSERALSERLGVKRHRLRMALETLRDAGELGPAKAGRRATAPPSNDEALVSVTNPIEVIELRFMLEPALARLAALRASPFEIQRIVLAASTPPGSPYGTADFAFHRAVAVGSRNGLAVELYRLLRQVGTDARVRVGNPAPPCPKRLARRDAEHRAIADAISTRDPEAAEQAMRAHLAAVQRQIMERLSPGLTAA
jgi:GntR family transcriptional repressor for pyruvate dehydrogenase complex